VPLSFAPSDAYRFDWSREIVLLNGTTVTVEVPHVRLCRSRMLFVSAQAFVELTSACLINSVQSPCDPRASSRNE